MTIRMDAERDGAIPLTELAKIAQHVQEAVDRIARGLSGKDGSGRPPDELRKLSKLEAVGIEAGSAVLQIEAPHDMEEFPLDFGQPDAGVQAVGVFVASLAALSEGEDPPESVSESAQKAIRSFLRAVDNHESVTVTSEANSATERAHLVPRLVKAPVHPEPTEEPESTVQIVGRLYSVNLDKHSYRVRDEFGRSQHFTLDDDLDQRQIARALLGETVNVTATWIADEAGEPMQATAVSRVEPPSSAEYRSWDALAAIEAAEALRSIEDLAIPDLDEAEVDAFLRAVQH